MTNLLIGVVVGLVGGLTARAVYDHATGAALWASDTYWLIRYHVGRVAIGVCVLVTLAVAVYLLFRTHTI